MQLIGVATNQRAITQKIAALLYNPKALMAPEKELLMQSELITGHKTAIPVKNLSYKAALSLSLM